MITLDTFGEVSLSELKEMAFEYMKKSDEINPDTMHILVRPRFASKHNPQLFKFLIKEGLVEEDGIKRSRRYPNINHSRKIQNYRVVQGDEYE